MWGIPLFYNLYYNIMRILIYLLHAKNINNNIGFYNSPTSVILLPCYFYCTQSINTKVPTYIPTTYCIRSEHKYFIIIIIISGCVCARDFTLFFRKVISPLYNIYSIPDCVYIQHVPAYLYILVVVVGAVFLSEQKFQLFS